MKKATRLPGIYFEAQASLLDESLPRMDIAAFVGFARSGPLDTPVPIESVRQFQDIFGLDVVLIRDTLGTALGYLGASIEAFFANGGIRCWIVRVADTSGEEHAETYQFPIKHLLKLNISEDNVEAQDVISSARSEGSWALQWQIEATTHLSTLQYTDFSYTDGWSISVLSRQALQVSIGELLKFILDDGTFWYGFVDLLGSDAGLITLKGNWILVAEPQDSSLGEWHWVKQQPETILASPSIQIIGIQQVRLDLLARHSNGQVLRIDGLAFNSRHPRFWGQLPNDQSLFAQLQGELQSPISVELARLRAQAQEPRFPLAGFDALYIQNIQSKENELFYLPEDPQVMKPISERVESSKNISDGLEKLDASIFLNGGDKSLNNLRLQALESELEHRYYIRKETLKGLYSLLPIQEISLLSLPDLVHLSSREPYKKINPAIPSALELSMITLTSGQCLRWNVVPGFYTLECADTVEFYNAMVIYQGDKTEYCLVSDNACQPVQYYRVRVQQQHITGLWSNIVIDLPLFNQGDCSIVPKLSLYLYADEADTDTQTIDLHWTSNQVTELPELTYQLQESDQANFTSVLREQTIAISNHLTISIAPQSVYYFRIRAVLNEQASYWSNVVQVVSVSASNTNALPISDDGLEYHIIAVHRAMLRFCTARQDILAILSLPTYNREQLLLHVNNLSSAHKDDEVIAGVLPLSFAELKALDYAAIFHPWIANASPRASDNKAIGQQILAFIPCDGAICGSMAKTALHFGAWVASANTPLADALALHPELNKDDWQQLDTAQVNLVRQDGRGFLLMNADTLSRSEENRPVNVRRLMILLRRLVLREGNRNVFEPDSIDFRNRIHHYFTRLLTNLYSRGAFTGNTQDAAFRVVVDSSVNTQQSIDRGRFIVELRVAPSRPLEFLTVRLMQTGENTVFSEGVNNG